MLVEKNVIIESNLREVAKKYLKNTKQSRLEAKLLEGINSILEKVELRSLEVDVASRKSETFNIGTQLEPCVRWAVSNDLEENKSRLKGCDGVSKYGVEYEIKTLVNNTPNAISEIHNVYVLVYKATCKGIYKISSKVVRDNNLIGKRLGLAQILEYGVYLKGASNRLGL